MLKQEMLSRLTGRAIPKQVASNWNTKRLAAIPVKASLKDRDFFVSVSVPLTVFCSRESNLCSIVVVTAEFAFSKCCSKFVAFGLIAAETWALGSVLVAIRAMSTVAG
jgi:hypothetical protein